MLTVELDSCGLELGKVPAADSDPSVVTKLVIDVESFVVFRPSVLASAHFVLDLAAAASWFGAVHSVAHSSV